MHVGGGHAALRDSFAQVLARVDSEQRRFEPVVWDSSDTKISDFYTFVVRRIPWFQRIVFGSGDLNWAIRLGATNPLLYKEARDVLLREQPDVVISTHLVMTMMFARVKHDLGLPTQVVMAIPDYGIATKAFFPEQEDLKPDYALVMDDLTQKNLVMERASLHHWSTCLDSSPALRSRAPKRSERPKASALLWPSSGTLTPNFVRWTRPAPPSSSWEGPPGRRRPGRCSSVSSATPG